MPRACRKIVFPRSYVGQSFCFYKQLKDCPTDTAPNRFHRSANRGVSQFPTYQPIPDVAANSRRISHFVAEPVLDVSANCWRISQLPVDPTFGSPSRSLQYIYVQERSRTRSLVGEPLRVFRHITNFEFVILAASANTLSKERSKFQAVPELQSPLVPRRYPGLQLAIRWAVCQAVYMSILG